MVDCEITTLPYQVAFTASIPVTGVGAATLDLSADPWCVTEGTRFDPPGLRRAAVTTLLADGETYPATAYDNRILQLRLAVQTSSADDLAEQVQLLMRQLDKPNNIIRVQVKTTEHVYFRTFRVSADQIDVITHSKRTALIAADIPAEPSGYGPKETIPAVNVSNDPAAASNGLFLDVTSVKGDLETPAVLKAPTDNLVSSNDNQSLFAIRRRGTPANTPFLLQAESMTTVTDTSAPGNDAAMSGSGSNYMRTTFATATAMTTRLFKNPHPASASVDNRGTYRVFMRYRKSVIAGGVIKVRMRWGGNAVSVTNDTVTLPSGTSIRYADLGLMSMPAGPDPVTDGLSNIELSVRGMYVSIQAERTSGSENLDIDYLLFVPADDRLMLVKWSGTSGADNYIVDASRDMIYQTMTAGEVRNTGLAEVAGGFPMLSPNQTNRIYFIRQVRPDAPTDTIGGTNSWEVQYWPRYLHVRPLLS